MIYRDFELPEWIYGIDRCNGWIRKQTNGFNLATWNTRTLLTHGNIEQGGEEEWSRHSCHTETRNKMESTALSSLSMR